MNIGDIRIDRIVEMETPFMTPMDAFPDAPHELIREHQHWMEPTALCPITGKLIITIQTYVIAHLNILFWSIPVLVVIKLTIISPNGISVVIKAGFKLY